MTAPIIHHDVTSIDELREIMGPESASIKDNVTSYLTPLTRQFIMASPYFLMATAAADGSCDVTPRGDPPGSLLIPDDRTLVIPERLGNRRMDSLQNILSNGHIGMIFIVPGTDETLRVNGRVRISRDPALCEQLAMRGKQPNVVLIVDIDQVFTHCARSMLRAKIWDPATWPDADTIPTLAAMAAEQRNQPPPDETAGKRSEEYRTRLY